MAKRISPTEAVAQLLSTNHNISLVKAKKMARRFQKFRKKLATAKATHDTVPADTPNQAICYSYNKTNILQLLKPAAAVGLRIYPGINEENETNMILVAFDAAGNNITSAHADASLLIKPKTKKALKDGEDTNDPNDGILDDGMGTPPNPAPNTP